jgi:hypothetical protein
MNLWKSVSGIGLLTNLLLTSGCAARSVPAGEADAHEDAHEAAHEDAHGEGVEMALAASLIGWGW